MVLNVFETMLKLMARQNFTQIVWDGEYVVGYSGQMPVEASEFQPESTTREMWDDLEFALTDTKTPNFIFKLDP